MDLVETVYLLTRKFPKYEIYGLTSQLQKAVVSVPSNIAEGHTREHIKNIFITFRWAQASLAEVETQLEIATRLAYLTHPQLDDLLSEIRSLGRQLYALRNALNRS